MMRRSKGFTLLEVVISMAILGFIMAALYASLYSGTNEYEVNSKRAWAIHQARMMLDQMSEELRQATRTSVNPAMPPPNAPAESTPAYDNISFKMALPGGKESKYYITYMWAPSGITDASKLSTVMAGHAAPVIPVSPPSGSNYAISGATWVDGTGHNQQSNNQDNGMLLRIDPNNQTDASLDPPRTYPFKNVCNYLQGETGSTWTAGGFQVTQSVVQVNAENMLQIHLTLNLVFTDTRNKMLTQTLESKVFVRNLQ